MYRNLRNSKLTSFIIPLLVVLFIMPFNLAARAKYAQGVKMFVYKTDGEIIKGRLIKVDSHEGWFIVKPREALAGTRLAIDEVEKLRVKDVKVMRHMGGGLLIGLGFGLITSTGVKEEPEMFGRYGKEINTIFWGLLGLFFGSIQGLAKKSSGHKYRVKGKSKARKLEILKKLSKKAMIRQ